MKSKDWKVKQRSPDVLLLRQDERYQIRKWPINATVGREGPCPAWRYVPVFSGRPDRPPIPIGKAQLTAEYAGKICMERCRRNT